MYTRDALGNLTAIDHKNFGTSACETRTYNCLNQLTARAIVAHKPVFWIKDPFTDNDTDQWVLADINNSGSTSGDGT